MPTIAEIKARKAKKKTAAGVTRQTVTVTLTEGQHLVDEWTKLEHERLDLLARLGELEDERREILDSLGQGDEPTGPPAKTSQGVPPRLTEVEEQRAKMLARQSAIEAEKAALNASLADHQGDLTIQARQIGEWLRWCTEHPASEDNDVDQRLTGGQCSAVDLLDDLGTYAVAWDGNPLEPGDWDDLDLVPGDLLDLVRHVVALHWTRFDRVPKSQSPSSTTPSDESD